MDSEILQDTEVQGLPLTQEAVKSKIRYAFVILFEFNVDEENPFQIYSLKTFEKTNFPWRSIQSEMTRDLRIRQYELSCFPGKEYFIFAKVEYGKKIYIYVHIFTCNLCTLHNKIHF